MATVHDSLIHCGSGNWTYSTIYKPEALIQWYPPCLDCGRKCLRVRTKSRLVSRCANRSWTSSITCKKRQQHLNTQLNNKPNRDTHDLPCWKWGLAHIPTCQTTEPGRKACSDSSASSITKSASMPEAVVPWLQVYCSGRMSAAASRVKSSLQNLGQIGNTQ